MPKFAKYEDDTITGDELIVLKDVTATKTRKADAGKLILGGIGVPITHMLTDSTGANVTLTTDDVNYVYIIENGVNNVIYDISACFTAANVGAAFRFYKEGTGTFRLEPGVNIIGTSVGGVGYVENTTTETGAMIEIQIISATEARVVGTPTGSWDFES